MTALTPAVIAELRRLADDFDAESIAIGEAYDAGAFVDFVALEVRGVEYLAAEHATAERQRRRRTDPEVLAVIEASLRAGASPTRALREAREDPALAGHRLPSLRTVSDMARIERNLRQDCAPATVRP